MGTRNLNQCNNTVVCVDSYQKKVMQGRIYSPAIEGFVEFDSTMSFLLYMEELLEQMSFPKAYELKRSFKQAIESVGKVESAPIKDKGKLATFGIKVLFRQNTSWQGIVSWKETKKEESFRSVLELIMLLNSALA